MNSTESRAWTGLIAVAELLPAALDAQLQRDAGLTHFEFIVLSVLRVAPDGQLQLSELAAGTNSTLPRLSHVLTRLERRDLVARKRSATDGRARNARLTPAGRRVLIRAMPEHVDTARRLVIDALTPAQLEALGDIAHAIRGRLGGGADFGPDATGRSSP